MTVHLSLEKPKHISQYVSFPRITFLFINVTSVMKLYFFNVFYFSINIVTFQLDKNDVVPKINKKLRNEQ